jgi:hypothetical protein
MRINKSAKLEYTFNSEGVERFAIERKRVAQKFEKL